ncbi:DUF7344 domain-containing protein [Haloarcula onubensis]|uniref:DUF7344 domain-containing protein n=1 Tax=Haloarcula onubensis TaxID=2950539 RepID=A0ABU2FPF8_9EURY|nr:hypothetical protein [Halomicroarcula sp. S3CR25-11]MDS0282635.1 hypothetical protein [Halomicroarcula sp. S3CR25-11]
MPVPSPLLSMTGPVGSDGESSPTSSTIDETTVYEILSNERRRRCLKLLVDSDDVWAVRQLSERIAADVAGPSGSADDIYDSVYISLCQTHLPKLDDADLVVYDATAKTVTVGPAADALRRYWFPAATTTDDSGGDVPLALALSSCTLIGLGVGSLLPTLATPLLVAVVVCNLAVLAVGIGRRFDAGDR